MTLLLYGLFFFIISLFAPLSQDGIDKLEFGGLLFESFRPPFGGGGAVKGAEPWSLSAEGETNGGQGKLMPSTRPPFRSFLLCKAKSFPSDTKRCTALLFLVLFLLRLYSQEKKNNK